MKNICLKKSFICGIIVLLIGSGVVSAFYGNPSISSKPMNSGNWLYVGGSGPGNYTTIQSAIDAANPGDTVFVYSGTYHGHVTVDKSYVNLTGENKYTTIIDADGYGQGIDDAAGLSIPEYCYYNFVSGFTLINATYHAVWIHSSTAGGGATCNYNTISDCIIRDCNSCSGIGIGGHRWTDHADYNTIENCIVYNMSGGAGIYIYAGDGTANAIGNKILNCTSYNNQIGVALAGGGYVYDNSIINCSIYNNSICGIDAINNDLENEIYHNTVFNNSQNTHDDGINTYWYDAINLEGNYYDDYTGIDSNGDGIGDTPYNIPGGSNQDLYPFMNPNGWNVLPIPDIVYVDDDYNSSTPGWGYDHFSSVQAGIDAVDFNGSIFVFSGIYSENLFIEKNYLTIQGENKNTTIIDANSAGNVITIQNQYDYAYNGKYNFISGFTLRNAGGAGVYIHDVGRHGPPHPAFNTFSDCLIYNCTGSGIYLYSDHEGNVYQSFLNCNIFNNSGYGVQFVGRNQVYHTISDCQIYNNQQGGIYLGGPYISGWGGSGHHVVRNNSCYNNNGIGISITPYDNYGNIIYHNNFYNNTQNAYDFGSDALWFNTTLQEGNYWSDYTGEDDNHDGIGDTPYNIPGGSNQDLYPFIEQDGWLLPPNLPPVANFTYNPSSPTDVDVIQFTDKSTDVDGTITSWSWEFGDGSTSTLQNPTHDYVDDGNYRVNLTATDDDGASASISQYVVVSNVPPVADAGGPYYGSKVIPVVFDASNSKDMDGSIILYTWNFGDGKTGSGPVTTHQYTANGNYTATLTIKDDDGATDSDTAVVHIITGNLPPYIPKNPHPGNNAVNVSIEPTLSWTGGDPDFDDTVTYDVYLGSMPPFEKVASNISTTSFEPGALANSLTYFWNVVAWDNHGASTNGPGWYFTTLGTTNNPPNKPSKPSGQVKGKPGVEYSYTTSTTDPDGDQVYYLWDWGDGNNSGWLGPYGSGVTAGVTHNWTVKGSYSIKVKAKDIYGENSSWSDPLPITMPYTYKPPLIQFLELLFQRFSHAFPLLRHLMGY